MMIQTTIFDFTNQESKFHFGDNEFIDVKAIIPGRIRTPYEADVSKREFDEWTNYCLAIQFCDRGTWADACEKFKKHRDSRKPVRLRIYERSEFRPETVVD